MVAFYQAIYFLNGCIFELNFIFLKLCFRYVSFVRLTVLTEKHFKTVEKHFRLSRSVQWTKFVHEVIFFPSDQRNSDIIERIIQFLDSFFWLAFHMPHSKIPNCHFKCLLTGETLYIKWTLKESWNRSEKKNRATDRERKKNSLPKINPSICETLSRLIRAFVEHIWWLDSLEHWSYLRNYFSFY